MCLFVTDRATAQARVEKNVIFGMYSGLALLMDVHYPEQSNGHGIIFVSGSGWQAPLTYAATPLKEQQVSIWGPPLLRAGYTVFAINHRATPRFHYPAPLEDVQRAVRFVRHHAERFGIDPQGLGGVAGSSGGHLVALTGMLAAGGLVDDEDPINRQPAALQALVLRAAPTNLLDHKGGALFLLMNRLSDGVAGDEKLYRAASPITHVSPSSPPVLLLHGDSDDTVAFEQSVGMEAALRRAKVPVKLVRVKGGEHGPNFGTPQAPHPQLPDVLTEMVAWLDQYLPPSRTPSRSRTR